MNQVLKSGMSLEPLFALLVIKRRTVMAGSSSTKDLNSCNKNVQNRY